MKLSIFGSSGLVGRNLCDVIRDWPALPFDKIELPRSADLDLLDMKAVESYFSDEKPDVVINLAGKVGGILANKVAGADFYFENILMNAHVYEACARHGVSQLVSLGAGCGYPLQAPEPLRESSMFDGLPQPESVGYSMAKKMLLVQEEVYRRQHDLPSTIIIPSNIYGKYDNFSLTDSHVIPALVRKFCEVRHGIADEVSVWGDGSASRDFIDAYDVGRAIMLCVQHKATGVYNVGYGEQQTISQIVSMLSEISGTDNVVYDTSMPSGQKSREFSVEKFSEYMSDFNARDILEGLRETYEWFDAHFQKGQVRL